MSSIQSGADANIIYADQSQRILLTHYFFT